MSAIIQIIEPEDYEDCVSAAITEREKKDRSQWRLGDIATRALGKTVSGRDSGLADFAGKIGMHASTISDYKALSEFYPEIHRHRYENMSYTHYRQAWRANRDSLHDALACLDQASSESWSADAFRHELRKKQGKPEPQDMTLAEVLERFGADTVVRVRDLETMVKMEMQK